MQINKLKNNKGFTLIELMVSVSIFAIVVLISMSAVLTIVDANKKAQSLKSVMNNLNFALETMTRSIKTGTMTLNPDDITVIDQDGNTLKYFLADKQIKRTVVDLPSITSTITAPEVIIDKLEFRQPPYIVDEQPSVIMIVKGTAKLNERISSDFSIQSTITQRLPGL